jgi:hypothetical protein
VSRVAVVSALLGLAACGGGDGGSGLVGPGPTTPTTPTTAAAAPGSTASPTSPTAPAGATGATTTTAFTGPTGGPLEIHALDYSFRVPTLIPKSATSIRLVNDGMEVHELIVGRINDGVTLEQVKAATSLKTVVPMTNVLDVEPGQSAEVAIDVTAGNWFMACYLTTKDGKSHADLGMIGQFTAP